MPSLLRRHARRLVSRLALVGLLGLPRLGGWAEMAAPETPPESLRPIYLPAVTHTPAETLRPYSPASAWNTPIGAQPVYDARSELMVATLALDSGGRIYSTIDTYNYTVYFADGNTPVWDVQCTPNRCTIITPEGTRKVSVLEAVPIPALAQPSSGDDAGMIVIDKRTLAEYDLRGPVRTATGWTVGNGWSYNLRWDAAPPHAGPRGSGIPFMAGLVRPWEIAQGRIEHAIAFTYPFPAMDRCVFPAARTDGDSARPFAIPEGARLQLNPALTEADFNAMGLDRAGKIIARALQAYGMILVDDGGRPKIYVENLVDNPYSPIQWSDPTLQLTSASIANIPYTHYRVLALPESYWSWAADAPMHGQCYAYPPAGAGSAIQDPMAPVAMEAARQPPTLAITTTLFLPAVIAPRTTPGPVVPAVETDPVPSIGDAADDPAIWVHPIDPSLSLLLGTDKRGGLAVYDLAGRQRQYLPDGQLNNVDLRYGFPLGGAEVTLVTASNRSDNRIAAYRIEVGTRTVVPVPREGLQLSFSVYGACMYHSPVTGQFFTFITSQGGRVEQWALSDDGLGQVTGQLVRSFAVGSQTEGCVADDDRALLFVSEEAVGIWQYGAEPGDGNQRVQVDSTGPGGHLAADVEGLALYRTAGGGGYLIASSQGKSEFVVYDRQPDHRYVVTFQVQAGDGIDAVSGTDGIEVASAALGAAFPYGVFVAQDGRNDEANQNFKLVSWQVIAHSTAPPLSLGPPWSPWSVAQR